MVGVPQDSTITSLEQLLKIKLAHTTLTTDDDGIPQASSLPTLRFSHFEPCGVHKQVFSLGRALFDPLGLTDMPAEQSDTISAHARRAALLSWWSEHTATDVENAWRKAANPLEGTYALLTGYQIARATDSAADQLDLRLATLLSQAGTSSVDFKTDVHNQLLKWQNLDMSNHIDKTYRAILSLLAGHAPPTSLDWRRRLACTLFYHSDDLSRALNSYMPTGEAEEDYSYELVRLFCRLSPALEHTLLPHHFPGSTTVERNLQSWITHQLLSKVHRFTDFEEPDAAAAQLSVDLAASLESAGLWPWAVFVLLHLPSAFK